VLSRSGPDLTRRVWHAFACFGGGIAPAPGRGLERRSAAVVDVESLFRQHARYLQRVLRRRFDQSLIEDACASAWAIAWTHRERIADQNLIGWLVTVARREALRLLRRRGSEISVEALSELAGHRDEIELAVEARECLALLRQLGPNQRLALSLRVAGFGYREIVELTGKTHTWMNRHVAEGRARLRRLAGC
jgi:RNA polymerase sigma factor (sigma-70 family)